jgi:glycosyltransferase involved in cell wall biosynthesis
MVLLEAMACGAPVAAFPTPGPLDVVGASGAGVLDEDLRAAALAALTVDREIARAHALTFTWENSARQFLDSVNQARGAPLLGEKAQSGDQNAAGLSKLGLPI